MNNSSFTMRKLCPVGIVLLWFGIFGHAQTPVNSIPAGVTWVTDGWRYHPGDNSAWADPGLTIRTGNELLRSRRQILACTGAGTACASSFLKTARRR